MSAFKENKISKDEVISYFSKIVMGWNHGSGPKTGKTGGY